MYHTLSDLNNLTMSYFIKKNHHFRQVIKKNTFYKKLNYIKFNKRLPKDLFFTKKKLNIFNKPPILSDVKINKQLNKKNFILKNTNFKYSRLNKVNFTNNLFFKKTFLNLTNYTNHALLLSSTIKPVSGLKKKNLLFFYQNCNKNQISGKE